MDSGKGCVNEKKKCPIKVMYEERMDGLFALQ